MMDLDSDGYTIAAKVLSTNDCEGVAREIAAAMRSLGRGAIESARGTIVGGQNMIDAWDGWRQIVRRQPVADWIRDHVSQSAGLVRVFYFDKPPGQSWSLSMHRDRTIAVAKHQPRSPPFSRPTVKAGVPHVVATDELLSSMLTLRLHLDPMTHENGPLTVVPGSHRNTESARQQPAQTIQCNAGDLFFMRPLLLHGSLASEPATLLHRRVIHMELGPSESLPGEYRWHRFEPVFG